ncbi:MAG: flippase [Chloroflexota bacterium]
MIEDKQPSPFLTTIRAKLGGNSLDAIIARGASGTFFVDGLGQGLVFGAQILLARLMGAEHYGVYAYVLAWVTLLFLLARLGMDTMLLRYIATYRANHEWGLMRGVVQMSNLWGLVSSLVVGSITAGIVWFWRESLGEPLAYAFWAGCGLLPFFVLSGLCQSSLNGIKKVVLAQLPNRLIRQTLLVLLVMGGVWLIGIEMTGATAILLTIVAVLGGYGIGVYWLWRHLPEGYWSAKPIYRNREWLLTAFPLMLAAGAYMLTQKTDTLMIGAMLGTTDAGIYAVASRIAEFTSFGLTAATAIAAPHMSEFFSQKKRTELQRVVSLTTWGAIAFSIPFAVVVVVLGTWLLSLFGSAFTLGYWALVLLVAGQVANTVTGPIGVLMNMTGHQNHLLIILVGALVLNAILNYFFILSMGIAGAALATALVKVGWNVVAVSFVYRKFGINCFAFHEILGSQSGMRSQ